jgi:hypothetical protein
MSVLDQIWRTVPSTSATTGIGQIPDAVAANRHCITCAAVAIALGRCRRTLG